MKIVEVKLKTKVDPVQGDALLWRIHKALSREFEGSVLVDQIISVDFKYSMKDLTNENQNHRD